MDWEADFPEGSPDEVQQSTPPLSVGSSNTVSGSISAGAVNDPPSTASGRRNLSCMKIVLTGCWSLSGFYDDLAGGTFGTVKKGIRRPLSNFNFEFCSKIVSTKSSIWLELFRRRGTLM